MAFWVYLTENVIQDYKAIVTQKSSKGVFV